VLRYKYKKYVGGCFEIAGVKKIREIIKRIEDYILENRDGLPILKECCLKNGWDYGELLELAEEHIGVKKAVEKLQNQKEVNLEKGGITGKLSKPMSAYLLERLERERAEKSMYQALEVLDGILKMDEEAAALTADAGGFGDIVQEKVHNETD